MENIRDYHVQIVTGQYQKAPQDQQHMIQALFGENAGYRYELYFHWYNVLHELGHAVMTFNASSRPHPAEEEQLVNDFAYAYWKHYGEQSKLDDLRSVVEEALRKLSATARPNESYMDYAKAVWGTEEMFTFNNYGWFQFSSVRAAITGGTDLEQALNRMGAGKVTPVKAETLVYAVDDRMPGLVAADALRLLKEWGVRLPDSVEILFCDDVNRHMCRVKNLRDGSVC